MKEAPQPLIDLASRPSVMPSPKQDAISVSRRPHVRIEVVTYDPMRDKDGNEYFCHHGRRIDLSISAFKRVVKTTAAGPERETLTETLKAAGLWT